MKFSEIKCYKQQKNGELKLVKVIKRRIRGRQLHHHINDACLPHNHIPEKFRKGLKLYEIPTVVSSYLRTSQHPEGKLQWREVYHGYYWLDTKLVKKLGVVGAYQEQRRRHFERVRKHPNDYKNSSVIGLV